MSKGQIGFDLDSTLAVYTKWEGSTHIGEPIKPTVELAKKYMSEGWEVVIFTARVAPEAGVDTNAQRQAIYKWCEKVFGKRLQVTCMKSRSLVHYFDDRASGVIPNKGLVIGGIPNLQPHPFPNGMPK